MNIVDFDVQSIGYGDQAVLRDIKFQLKAGEFLGIMGPSGVGKSTILRVMVGFHHDFVGRCEVLGHDIARSRLSTLRAGVSFMFQKSPLMDDMTVEENLELAMLFLPDKRAVKKAALHEVLATLNLLHVREAFPDQLSGGMRRRVLLAASILRRPKLLLCDEPFTGQDPITKDGLVDLLRAMGQKYGFALILVSHDVRETMVLCERLMVLMDGQIKAFGNKEEVLSCGLGQVQRFLREV